MNLRKDQPDLVFNLASIYAWDKTNLIPAVLEIGQVPYTGSGILGLSLARSYTRLFPLLLNSGVRVPDFALMKAGLPLPGGLRYPLFLLRDGLPGGLSLSSRVDLEQALSQLPAGEEVLLREHLPGQRVSLFLLDQIPLFPPTEQPYLAIARQAYSILEARGLARFDFIRSPEPLLENVEIAPDPLDEQLVQAAAALGWDEDRLLEALLQHSGRDHSLDAEPPDRQRSVSGAAS